MINHAEPPVAGVPRSAPTEHLLREGRPFRYERGGSVYATDGLIGTVRQVVVDETSGEITALVVALAGTTRSILVPLDLVDKTAGTAVFLTIATAQFMAGAVHAPQYDKHRFTAANAKTLVRKANGGLRGDARRLVGRVGRHFVETRAVTGEDRNVHGPGEVLPSAR